MGENGLLATVAIVAGLVLGVVLFVPFVAVSYRRHGKLSFGGVLAWFAALVYFWAIWAYTLLPLPNPDAIQCLTPILDPMSVVNDVREAFDADGNPFLQRSLLQLEFNVLLFVPLGFFIRLLTRRGVIVSLLAGFGLSLFVETTQLTGVWGLYRCAYRFFDVGDLMTNTTGAVLGSLVGLLLIPASLRGMALESTSAGVPRPVTRGRRALAMLCDGLGFVLLGFAVDVAARLWISFVMHRPEALVDNELLSTIGTCAAAAVWLVTTLVSGQSVGDFAVRLRYTGGPVPRPIARVLRWLGGISGIALVGLLPGHEMFQFPLFALSCIMFFCTRLGRGLPGLLSGQHLRDDREA